jgi:hypothetical protein
MDTIKAVTKTLAKTSIKHAELRHAATTLHDAFTVEEAAESVSDDVDDAEEAEADNDEPVGATVTPLRVVPPPSEPSAPPDAQAAQAAEEQRARVLHGKDQWIALIEVWRDGFMVEDAEQPDRVRNLQGAANPFTLAYLRTKAGLTDATREAIYLLDGGDPDATVKQISKAQLREARLIAENIAQVASFHAPWLTEQLEYAYEFRTLPPEE